MRQGDHLFVGGTIVFGLLLRDGAVRDMDVLGPDVHMIEKRFLHPAAIAVKIVRRQAEVFVQVKGYDAGKIETSLLVHADQRAVDANGSRAGGQSQDRRLAGGVVLPDEALNHDGNMLRCLAAGQEDQRRNSRVRYILARHCRSFQFLIFDF